MNTAKIIKPTTIVDSMLVSSTVAEADYPAWVSGGSYSVGDKRIRTGTHRIYESLTTHSGVSTLPENDSTNWLDISPTNRWAMFDNVVGTITTDASPLTVVLEPGSVAGLGLLELVGREAQVTMKDASGGTVVYDETVDLDGTIVESFFDWFFVDFEQRTDFVLTDLPSQFTSCELTISVTATSGNASIGVCKVGAVVEIGRTLAGAKAGIINYSAKTTDAFGNTVITERAYSKRATLEILTDSTSFNRIFRRLAELRATPAIYIGTESSGYDPLIVYGFFRDFSIDVAYPSHHLCSIEVEGII